MKPKTKYILSILVISGFALLYYNHNNELTETSFDSTELKYAKRFFGIGILCLVLYFFNKKLKNLLTKIMFGVFGISLALNLYIFPRIYESVRINKIYYEYSEIETCEEMEKRFATDLKNGEIKYFQFGIGYNVGLEKTLKEQYNIETFGMGCTIQSEKECYNKLVNEYLKKDFNKSISDIEKESDLYKLIENN
ncbi:hypothetical protein HHX25_11150 [Flavivirga sp. Y03]|uniref:Uncharacterized protein n=1 Tax=Flavivirga algicola TaxID=2729136 RepID=A0ABX1RWW1_9FLAO|nr:hypothetical protein [Flavivirga algicola]